MSDQTISLMSEDMIEAHKARLRQYAAILADFHEALVGSSLPADSANGLVLAWWENELTFEAG